MGLIRSILLAPVTLPLDGVTWIAEQVLEAGRDAWYDLDAIRAELGQLGQMMDRGEIDEADFAAREEQLLDRLEQAQQWHGINIER